MKINDLLNIKSNYSNDEKKIILSFLLDLPKLDLFKLEEITDKKVINKYKKINKRSSFCTRISSNRQIV